MLINDKEEKIKSTIEDITGKKPDIKHEILYDLVKDYRTFQIKKILILSSSSFNYFLLEEEGRLKTLFSEISKYDDNYSAPEIIHVETGEDCLKLLEKNVFDLLIIFNKQEDTDIINLSKKIKKISQVPIALLGSDLSELRKLTKKELPDNIKKIFTWNGDGKIILSIVQYFEDIKNLEQSSLESKRCILLIEDSIQHYSSYFLLIHDEIYCYLKDIITNNLSYEQRLLRYKRKPFVLHAKSFEEGLTLYEKYKDELICIITDNYSEESRERKQAGIELANKISVDKPNLQILILSSEPIDEKKILGKKIKFVSKSSHSLINILGRFLKDSIGPREIIFKDAKGKEIAIIRNMQDFEDAIPRLDAETILRYTKINIISKWLNSLGEVELSQKFLTVENEYDDSEKLKNRLLELLEDYRYYINQIAISSFERNITDPFVKISRIGRGALGGKARGIAFLAKILSKYITEDMFPGLKITVPRSIVLSTDVFDTFIDHNHLSNLDFSTLSDERISAKFLEASLPAAILGDLRSFVKNTRKPLMVRSSGLLEDSLMQPFAGIYTSMLLPNESWEADFRFQDVCNAIKHVYASTYFEKARTYIKSTPKNIGDEKMAVLIQEVVGSKHDNYFYPIISGVAKSYNFYPQSLCKPEDGIVYLALGLGKSIVDGGSSYAFCPEKPKAPLFGTPKLYMKYAQTTFYSLNLKSVYRIVNYNEETTLDKLDIKIAKEHGVLDKIASTYFPKDDNFYPGIYDEGYIVIDFAPIINYDQIPLVKAIKLLLRISEIALGYPVEIEFAMNIPKEETKPAELIILQLRSMITPDKKVDIDIEKVPKDEILFYSENTLGNGTINDISEIVYVKQDVFDMSHSNEIVSEIRKINNYLMEEKKPYILIGPGRWGSTDPWLGIPVIWSDIAGAKVIVETPYKERPIDPSQGSHFFHDMMASQVGYIITKKETDIDWKWINSLNLLKETKFIKHVKSTYPLQIIIDGKLSKALIRKKPK